MKAFMKEELRDRGTIEFPGIERFCDEKGQPIPFILKRLSRKRLQEIRERHREKSVFYDKNKRPVITADGQVAMKVEYDADAATAEIMVEAFVQPKLDDPEAMKYYGVLDRLDMPGILFLEKEEYDYVNQCVSIACGLVPPGKKDEAIDEIKN